MKEEAASKKLYQGRIAQLFRAVRKQHGLSQKRLSEKLNISQGFLSKIEAGVSIPDIVVWLSFCREFHITASLILSEQEFSDYLDKIDPECVLRNRPVSSNEEIGTEEDLCETDSHENNSMATL